MVIGEQRGIRISLKMRGNLTARITFLEADGLFGQLREQLLAEEDVLRRLQLPLPMLVRRVGARKCAHVRQVRGDELRRLFLDEDLDVRDALELRRHVYLW